MNLEEEYKNNTIDIYFEDFHKVFDRKYILYNLPIDNTQEKQMFRLYNDEYKLWYTFDSDKIIGIKFKEIYLWVCNYKYEPTGYYFMYSLKRKYLKNLLFPSIAFDTMEELREHLLKYYNKELEEKERELYNLNNKILDIKTNFQNFKKIGYKINSDDYENKEE
jgi:hypothetical protein